MALSGGRVALVVGDVVGHGVAASAVMGQLRAVLADRLDDSGDITTALAAVDRLARRLPAARAATVCMAVLDPGDGSLSYCTAGHPPPLVIPVDGPPRYLPPTGGGPLGTGSTFPLDKTTLHTGEVLLLYSDGILERPGREITVSTVELAQVAADTTAGRALHTGESSPVERARDPRGARPVEARLPSCPTVLDLGCGAGVPCTALLAEHGDVVGVDISTSQIELARKNPSSQRRSNG
ncbi:MAG TPA: SpoIIE family protein phosphatase [Pseudonocardiaceae bacterium]